MYQLHKFDLWEAYRIMLFSRCYEELTIRLWEEGKISGELHSGIGEEALMTAIVSQLNDDDAIAVDHRGTIPFLLKGISPEALLLEFIGHPDGLCGGHGGHMHLFSKPHLASSSGIIGAAGPAAVGYGLAAKYQKRPTIAIAFFGEGSLNQGMLLESFNLAAVWKLPVLFVCKNNGWAITTRSEDVSRGSPLERAKGFGIEGITLDGTDVEGLWYHSNEIISSMRKDPKPYFLNILCTHREGHFLGDPLLRFYKSTAAFIREISGPLIKSVASPKGASLPRRVASLGKILSLIIETKDQTKEKHDPIYILHKKLSTNTVDRERIMKIEKKVETDIEILYTNVVALLTEG